MLTSLKGKNELTVSELFSFRNRPETWVEPLAFALVELFCEK